MDCFGDLFVLVGGSVTAVMAGNGVDVGIVCGGGDGTRLIIFVMPMRKSISSFSSPLDTSSLKLCVNWSFSPEVKFFNVVSKAAKDFSY